MQNIVKSVLKGKREGGFEMSYWGLVLKIYLVILGWDVDKSGSGSKSTYIAMN
jgi:hypothetical protein